MSNTDLASLLQLFAVLVLLAPAGIYMMRNRRQSSRHLGIWGVIVVIIVAIALIFR